MLKSLVPGIWFLLASQGQAACVDGVTGPMPVRMIEETGQVLEITERTADTLSYRRVIGGEVHFDITVRSGLFLLASRSWDGVEVLHEWDGSLPDIAEFKVGAVFAEGGAVRQTSRSMLPVEFEVRVLAEEEINLAGCLYPVLKIETIEEIGAMPARVEVVYLHAPTQTVLKTERVINGTVEAGTRVVTLD